MTKDYHRGDFFDRKRVELIAAFLSHTVSAAEKIYTDIYNQLENSEYLHENEQKALNQIQVFILKFKQTLNSDTILRLNEKIRKSLSSRVRKETKTIYHIDFDSWQTKSLLNVKQLEILYRTTTTFQLTSGCSNYCRRCNEWALPGVRKQFSFKAIQLFSKKIFGSGNNEFIYYGASDPLDWQDKSKDISDLITFLNHNNFKPSYGLLTKLPLKKSGVLNKLIQQKADLSISLTDKNRKRVEAVEALAGQSFGRQHDVNDLLIPAGLDEDFSSVKSSITDSYGSEITPDGAFIVIPAFTSALNLTGQKRIPVTKETTYFIAKKTGRQALPVAYFKPFDAIDLDGNVFKLSHLLDVQIENIILDNGDETITPPGMMNLEEFFKTFDKEAVLRKKAILPSMITQYKQTFLGNKNYRTSSQAARICYRKNLERYLMLCNNSKMKALKKFSFSYFLNAIINYLKLNPAKREIIRHLKRKERVTLEKRYADVFKTNDINVYFELPGFNHFDLFQILILRLIKHPDDEDIRDFIDNNSAVYDESSDMFVGN